MTRWKQSRYLLVSAVIVAGGVGIYSAISAGSHSTAAHVANDVGQAPQPAPGIVSTNSEPLSHGPVGQLVAHLPGASQLNAVAASQDVAIAVDGVSVSMQGLGEQAASFENNYAARVLNQYIGNHAGALPSGSELSEIAAQVPAPTTFVEQAVAIRLLDQMLYKEAQQQGSVVPLSVAQAEAEQNYQAYLKNPQAAGPAVTKASIISPRAVKNLQWLLTVDQEETKIAGSYSPNVNRTPALEAWIQKEIQSGSVKISVSSASGTYSAAGLPAMLPPDL